ncbi:MAG: Crp/Fnr family transcriptional regulator [Bacilli bacterium]|nr:Crp/Fnr family transcriptional regulator [Bacilli bacterium]
MNAARINMNELLNLLSTCANAHVQTFCKGEMIQLYNAKKRNIGIIIEGSANLYRSDYNGDISIMEKLIERNVFSETILPKTDDNFFLVSMEETKIAYIDYLYLYMGCNPLCTKHAKLTGMLFNLLLLNHQSLNEKMDILTKKSMQEKLLAYFKKVATEKNAKTFTIPYNLKELAEYLCMDRSAMMRELKKMKEARLIKRNSNKITLYKFVAKENEYV